MGTADNRGGPSGLHGMVIGGGGGLAFGEAVTAVVFDDIYDGHVAPDHVAEVSEADGGGVAVATHADVDEFAVGDGGAGGELNPCA